MKNTKLGVIFGGMSTEHDISVISGKSIINNLKKEKYEIYPIYIDKQGNWYKNAKITEENKVENQEKIENITQYLKKLDVVFPILHGKYGEDGTLQGMLELLKIPTVGCGVLASSIAMDKVYAKIILGKANIKQAKYIYIKKCEDKYKYINEELEEKEEELKQICKIAEEKLKYPMFVKPSNSGSSVGINKAKNPDELEKYIEYASKFDTKILVEEAIVGKEIECAVMGNDAIKTSCVGEIEPAEEFYSFDAKYNDSNSKIIIPAKISEELSNEVRKNAQKAFKAIDGKGFARIDFFVNEKTKEVYLGEINTLPGFTPISMFPKLFEHDGIKYSDLLDELIRFAIEK